LIRTLETTRLLLRPLELADAEQTQQLFPHWEIVRYLANIVPWPYPAATLQPNQQLTVTAAASTRSLSTIGC